MFVVTVRWVYSVVNPPLIDAALSEIGEWIRFNAETWFVNSDRSPTEIRNLIIKHMSIEDNCLVVPLALYEPADGWAPPWIWEWLAKQGVAVAASRQPPPPPPMMIPKT